MRPLAICGELKVLEILKRAKKMVSKNFGLRQRSAFPQEGDVWLVKFEKLKEFSKPYRPCVVVSNNFQNEFDEKIVVVPTTTEDINIIEPFEVYVKNTSENGLEKSSKALCNYPHTVYKNLRLVERIGAVNSEIMKKIKKTLAIVLNLKID
jgi:mRNA-degrading endonuclease toxin of MazEF toxin-antitoxin module